jgi:uncharacterized membrane protein YkoI
MGNLRHYHPFMFLTRRRFSPWLLALVLALPAGTTLAQRAVSLQEAVERVQQETGGKILSAETVRIGRQKMYRIKVLTPDGRVRVMQIPAAGR